MAGTPDRQDEQQGTIRDLLRSLFREVEGINRRLDKVNGRLDRHEDAIADATIKAAALGQNVINLNHEVFDRRRDTPDTETAALIRELRDMVAATTSGDNRPAFTVRDINTVSTIGKLIWALAGLLGGAGVVYWIQKGAEVASR